MNIACPTGISFNAAAFQNNGSITISIKSAGNKRTADVCGGIIGNNSAVATVISWWNNRTVLTGAGVNAATVGQITLDNFKASTVGVTQAISGTHVIDASGVLVLK